MKKRYLPLLVTLMVWAGTGSSHCVYAQYKNRMVSTFLYSAENALGVSFLFDSLATDTLPPLQLVNGTTTDLTKNGTNYSGSIPFERSIGNGFLQLKDPGGNFTVSIGYSVSDSVALKMSGKAQSNDFRVSFLPDSVNNFRKVFIASNPFRNLEAGLPGGLIQVSNVFSIATLPAVNTFAGSNSIQVKYDMTFLAGQERESISLYYWNSTVGKWVVEAACTNPDLATGTISLAVSRPGSYVLMGMLEYTGVDPRLAVGEKTFVASDIVEHFSSISASSRIVSRAGSAVILSPGFRASRGSEFTTQLTGTYCGNPIAVSRPSASGGSTARVAGKGSPGTDTEEQAVKRTESGIKIYPNPFGQEFTVSYYVPVAQQVTITLHDMLGKPVRVLTGNARKEQGQQRETYNISGLKKGMYLVHVKLEKGGSKAVKVLKEY